jgi:hypothetical protein
MNILYVYIYGFIIVLITYFCISLFKKYKILEENLKLDLKIDCTNKEFASNYFKINKIRSKSKKAKYLGCYKPIFDIVILSNLDEKVSHSSINTILHEYKHKKDRLFLIPTEIFNYIIIINLILVLVSKFSDIKIYLPNYLIILFCVYGFLVKTIAEYRALKFSYKEMEVFIKKTSLNLTNKLILIKASSDCLSFFILYSIFALISQK